MKVAAFYKFMVLDEPQQVAQQIKALRERHPVFGTLIVADEGVNATLAGDDETLAAFIDGLQPWFGELQPKYARCADNPFHRFKVKQKQEIVTFHNKEVGPHKTVGTYVAPEAWNELVQADDVLLLDTRNKYETQIGIFAGAEDPQVDSFMAFKTYLDAVIDKGEVKKIAMYCTGGIRCEKSTGYALSRGVEAVYHLEGGILNYLEKVPPEDSLWQGECFVFDHRVSVDHALNAGSYGLCHSCGYPLSAQDQQHAHYEDGVSCHLCFAQTSAQQKARFRERKKQMALAAQRGDKHVGADMRELGAAKVAHKRALAERSGP